MKESNPYSLSADLKASIRIFIGLLLVLSLMGFINNTKSLNPLIIDHLELLNSIICYSLAQEDLSLFIIIFTTILGAILTILTILFTFEKSLKENITYQTLVKRGQDIAIYRRFTDSVYGLFWVIVLLALLYFLKLSETDSIPTKCILFFLITPTLIFGFLRVYRCFYLFSKLLEAMHREE